MVHKNISVNHIIGTVEIHNDYCKSETILVSEPIKKFISTNLKATTSLPASELIVVMQFLALENNLLIARKSDFDEAKLLLIQSIQEN